MHQKLYKTSQKILLGNYNLSDLGVFDESKAHFLKELVPYWAGYKVRVKEMGSLGSMTKQDKMLRERLEEFITMKNQSPNDFRLPPLSPRSKSATPTKPHASQSLAPPTRQHEKDNNTSMNIVFSIATGIRLKDDKQLHTATTIQAPNGNNERRNSRVSRSSGSVLIQSNAKLAV